MACLTSLDLDCQRHEGAKSCECVHLKVSEATDSRPEQAGLKRPAVMMIAIIATAFYRPFG